MKYAAVIDYLQDKAKVSELRPLHRQYLTGLLTRGKLVACGPFTDDSGALIIYEADSPQEADQLLQADPFHQNGIFLRYQLQPWNAVMANRQLFPEA
jgi:uncharacterized protein YciI